MKYLIYTKKDLKELQKINSFCQKIFQRSNLKFPICDHPFEYLLNHGRLAKNHQQVFRKLKKETNLDFNILRNLSISQWLKIGVSINVIDDILVLIDLVETNKYDDLEQLKTLRLLKKLDFKLYQIKVLAQKNVLLDDCQTKKLLKIIFGYRFYPQSLTNLANKLGDRASLFSLLLLYYSQEILACKVYSYYCYGEFKLLIIADSTQILDVLFQDYHHHDLNNLVEMENSLIKALKLELNRYFSGKSYDFTKFINLDSLTSFQQHLFQLVLSIDYGQLTTYKALAMEMNCLYGYKENAYRAVARALSSNRLLILIPCHRVIASNGELSGYAGGQENKYQLLKLEKSL